MAWSEILGHSDKVENLRSILAQGRLAHTYLFVGPPGIGKRTFALQLARCLLCERHSETELEACDRCPGCQQVLAGTHPDLFVVMCPEGKRELPIELFLGPKERRGKAGLCYELSHTPMAGRRKIAIIDDADLLNEESANALLKTLEEPPPFSLLILVASNIDGILPTIRSRCQSLRFAPLLPEQVAELLVQQGFAEDLTRAREAAALSEGSLTLATQLMQPELRNQRETLYKGLSAANFNSVALAAKLIEAVESAAGDTAGQRQAAAWLIRFCVEFYRGALWTLMSAESDEESRSTNRPQTPQTAEFCNRIAGSTETRLEKVAALMDRAILAETHLEQNVSVSLCLESLCDDLGRMQRGVSA